MLRTLLESQASPSRRAGGTIVSIGVHTAVIALAIVATARATSTPPTLRSPDAVYIVPPSPKTVSRDPRSGSTQTGRPLMPPVRPILTAPIVVPKELPPIDYTRPPINEAIFDGEHTRLGTDVQGGGPGMSSPRDGIYTPELVEKAAAARPGNPSPIYPAALRAAQLEGTILARFVVDTTGRAEPESIAFPESSHALFADAVRQALLRSRYLPAMVAGHPVRQLVEQRFAFSLTK